MPSVFHGGNTYIFYNEAADNTQPNNIAFKNIDQLGAFPQVKINSSNTSLETYNDEWTSVLSGNMTIDSVSIVVHYIADNESHQYLDEAYANGTNFQIKVSLYEYQDSLDQHYVMLSGYISGYQDSADQNAVYDRTYTFTAEDLVARGTATDPAILHVGDYGVGADGETTPHYEALNPTGNSFIKVPALRDDNPINSDIGGIAFVDNGGDLTAQLAMPTSGNLGLYIKNSEHSWTEIPGKTNNDLAYVPMARTVNGKALSSNITLSSTDIGAVPTTRTVNGKSLSVDINLTSTDTGSVPTTRNINGKPLSADVTLSSTDTGSVPVTTKINGKSLTDDIVLSKSDVGLGAVLDAVQLVASNNLSDLTDNSTARTNLSVYSKSEAVPIERTVNGKPLSDNVTLSSTDTGSFSIANNLNEGVPATIRNNISAAKSGDNSDINSLTALSGSLRLGADAVGAYDAVTLRQLQASTGSGSATINGVMNNFLGAVEWFLGSRGALPGGHLAADGQLLSRAAYPDLWSAISTGVLQSITDASWQSTPTGRGSYSTGDGSTTFRMPDLNGVWTHPTDSTLNSIPALFLRGDGAVANTGSGVGVIRWGAAPNITGSFTSAAVGTFNPNIKSGAISTGTGQYTGPASNGAANQASNLVSFNAASSNISYGRDSTTEVRPNSVKGIWLIRVNGIFSAANTNFHVINSDTSTPANGTTVYGGDVYSTYRVAGANYNLARIRSKAVIGGTKTVAFGLTDFSSGTTVEKEWTLPATVGELVSKGEAGYTSINGKSGGTISSALTVSGSTTVNGQFTTSTSATIGGLLTTNASINTNGAMTIWSQPASAPTGAFLNAPGLKTRLNGRGSNGDSLGGYGVMYFQEYVGNYHQLIFNLNAFSSDYNWFFRAGGGTYSPLGELQYSGSDKRLKSDFVSAKTDALSRINLIKPTEFTLNANGRRCRGYVAQDLQEIDNLYTYEGGESVGADGLKFNILNVDQTAIVSDLVAAVQMLSAQIEELRSQLNNK